MTLQYMRSAYECFQTNCPSRELLIMGFLPNEGGRKAEEFIRKPHVIAKCQETTSFLSFLSSFDTVDGRNPAPVDMINIPSFTGFCTSHLQHVSQRCQGAQAHELCLCLRLLIAFMNLVPATSLQICLSSVQQTSTNIPSSKS